MDLSQISRLIMDYSINIVLAAAIFIAGKWFAKRIIVITKRLMERHDVDSTIANFAGNIAYVALLAFVIIAALSQLGIPTASFVALVGAAGLAIGLALQGSLSNFASGVLLVLFHPIRLDDYVEAAGVSGSVKEINVFSTTLITPDRRTITVPNSLVLGGPIINYSTSTSRRIDLVISVGYDADLSEAKSLIEQVVKNDNRVLVENELTIGVLALAASSVDLAVRPWVASENYTAAKFELQEAIKNALDSAGISIPYPQLDVHLNTPSTAQVL